MIDLNAQVQAMRYGSKVGLEVLAEALPQIVDAVGQSGEAPDQSSREILTVALDLRSVFGAMLQQANRICSECARDFEPLVELPTNQKTASNGDAAQFSESRLSARSSWGDFY